MLWFQTTVPVTYAQTKIPWMQGSKIAARVSRQSKMNKMVYMWKSVKFEEMSEDEDDDESDKHI